MVVDSSALVALLRGEDEAEGFVEAIASAADRLLAAPTLAEASIVMLARFGPEGLADLQALIAEMRLSIVAFSEDHAALAVDAYRRFGKGRHPAALNLGDCFAYALAKATDQPLLYKGEDFARTDIGRAG